MSRIRVFQTRVRRLHIYAGLQACAGLVVFAAVTLVATQRDPVTALQPPQVRHHRLPLPGGLAGHRHDAAASPEALALAVTGALDLGPVQGPWLPRREDGRLTFLLGGPVGERSISYDLETGHTTETLAAASAADMLVYVHQVRPPLAGHIAPWLLAMGAFNLLCLGCLGFLAVSGVALFATSTRRPGYAWATLLVAAGASAAALLGLA